MSRAAAYRETFSQHRRLLTVPIVVAALIGIWAGLSSPKSYESTASLWVDNPASTQTSLGNLNPAMLPPSQQEQQLVTELLATRQFTHAVARRSGLERYLAAHLSTGSGPAALFSPFSGSESLDSRTADAINSSTVSTGVRGPQVLEVAYKGPTPALAQSTLSAIVTELQRDSAHFAEQHSQGTAMYNGAQVRSASHALATARNQLNAYLAKHPGARPNAPVLTALQAAVSAADAQLTQANSNLNSGASTAGGGGGGGSSAHLVDPPSVPAGPTSGKKKELMAALAGVFAGLLISFLGTIALTPSSVVRWEDDDPLLTPLEDPDGLLNPLGDVGDILEPVDPEVDYAEPEPEVDYAEPEPEVDYAEPDSNGAPDSVEDLVAANGHSARKRRRS